MAISPPIEGLVAATFTPFDSDGNLLTARVGPMVDRLIEQGIAGLYVLGSTGEGLSLAIDERQQAAAAFVEAAGGRIPVIVQVGCESLVDANRLAAHAQSIGADAISAVCPVYFKPASMETLVRSMAEIASGAPELPFYYYHIPAATGAACDMVEFLRVGGERISNLRGIKFTSPAVHEFQACLDYADNQFDILWGTDEMLHSGLVAGAKAAVGSTYNFAAPIYQQLLQAFLAGDAEQTRLHQHRAQLLVRTFVPFGPRAAQKAIMSMVGFQCGPPRLPIAALSDPAAKALQTELKSIGFFDWIKS
ncbi:dihydrodipicolinate synthase family protein [Stieleria sp. TO1_6]|uniref:dihydrodipicolinate synthase family protein n=1 Tax=Stieleria tagensis TaxID=2956795 RepID=UPI00209A8B22|nr:dihydrodipicolinate synthase family protein [Stieleria tagensis]MCO8123576.1 dihydrodipicolinate synthase family protein [Stieleria tagensis]